MSQTMTPGLDQDDLDQDEMRCVLRVMRSVDREILLARFDPRAFGDRSQWEEEVWRDVLEAWGELDTDINRAYSAVKSEAYAHAIAEGASTNIATVFADAAAVAYCSGAVQRLIVGYDALNWRWFRATERWS